ncbi:MAG: hypothetical protein ACLTAF_04690, partial [Blautia coccoides]
FGETCIGFWSLEQNPMQVSPKTAAFSWFSQTEGVTHSLPKTTFTYTPVFHPPRNHSFGIAYSVICHVAISQRRNYSSSLSRLAD